MGESVDSEVALRAELFGTRPDDRARSGVRRPDGSPDAGPPDAPPGTDGRPDTESPSELPPPGLYRHHKGADYRVLGCVRHSETEERLVLYRALYGERGLWVRPLELFVDTVERADGVVPRFALVSVDDDTS